MHGYSQPFAVANIDRANLICGVFGDGEGGEVAAETNAQLIAAAPELLAALLWLHAGIGEPVDVGHIIAKATGAAS